MKKLFLSILVCTVISVLCSKASFADDGKFVHSVYFWLKDADNKEVKDKFEASLKKLVKNSLYIKESQVGVPASTRRPVIDHTYSYCLILTFDSKEQHDKYQVEKAHDVFLEESKMLWEKIMIFDNVSILK